MPKTVLIADDSPIMRKLLCKMFEAEEDYDLCAEAANGEEAIALATEQRPELIISRFGYARDKRNRRRSSAKADYASGSNYSAYNVCRYDEQPIASCRFGRCEVRRSESN